MNIYNRDEKDVDRKLFKHDNQSPKKCISCRCDEFAEFLLDGTCDNCVDAEIERISRNKIR